MTKEEIAELVSTKGAIQGEKRTRWSKCSLSKSRRPLSGKTG